MFISILVDVLLALLIFSMPKLINNAIIRIIVTIIFCTLLFINNNKLIKKINLNYVATEENETNIQRKRKINIVLLIIASIIGVLSGIYLVILYN